MPPFDHFGLLAPFYEFFIKPRPPKELLRLANLPVSGALLDAGGGTGRVAQYFRDHTSQVVVADLSCRMLSESKEKRGLHPVCSHTEKLPFPQGYFERIIMIDAFHHVCNQSETARELWRVLKPGGLLIIEEPDVRKFAVKLVAWGEKIALMRSHFLAPPEIAALFHDLKAEIIHEQDDHIAWVVMHKNRPSS